MRTFILYVLLCLPALAHADCREQLANWAHQLYPGKQINPTLATCKVSPANPAETLVVLPIAQKANDPSNLGYDVDVMVVDSASNQVIAHLLEPSEITNDAITVQMFDLDTARYQLTPQLRAFGIRTAYSGSSRVSPFDTTTLDLYVLDGQTLRRVVSRLSMVENTGDWDGDCAGKFSQTLSSLALGAKANAGYTQLILSQKRVDTTRKPAGQNCASTDKPAKVASFDLDYNGTRYVVPAKLAYAK